ncbi:peptide/nickel transport system substrate-binding protein [Neorhizobium galegae]|uniref:ABC transporter substrate-binding protein n=1 Tax=Neorhizobium galegae TaxID=399 RepID=UPI001AE2A85E|nr:ABC transporter substrate-binding protein [Neorhizobium galegae]MBP2557254.1 peptide/nickel transport system substrate-binding protein [Neorhizobium galegae]
MTLKVYLFALASAASLISHPVVGKDLTIGLSGTVTSLDPHFYNASPNNSIAMQVFDRLTERTAEGQLVEGLATKWEAVEETTWRFTLREGVKWHDGVPFTADDVVFTLGRAGSVPNSPGGFGGFMRNIAAIKADGDLAVVITTKAPAPTLPGELANIAIVSRHAGEGADTADYNSGKAAIGTGAFRFSTFKQGIEVALERNPNWWGKKVVWDHATYRMISSASARTTAILAGDVDIIDAPAATDIARFKSTEKLAFVSTPGLRVIYLAPTTSGDAWKGNVKGANGEALEVNPLADPRVRNALSVAINREGIVDKIMEGTATASGQWLPKGAFSYSADIQPPKPELAVAKKMLAEAGFPNGFQLTVHVPNDRYPNAPAVVQAVAQMWTRIGVKTNVEALPWTTFSSRKSEFAMKLLGLGNATYDASSMLVNVLGTVDPKRGLGASNDSGYSNPVLDERVAKAMTIYDDKAREAALIEAVKVAVNDAAIIPLYQQSNAWVTRKGLSYAPRIDERTLAKDVSE